MSRLTPEQMRHELVKLLYNLVLQTIDKNVTVYATPGNEKVTFVVFGEPFETDLSKEELSASLDSFSKNKIAPIILEYMKTWKRDPIQ